MGAGPAEQLIQLGKCRLGDHALPTAEGRHAGEWHGRRPPPYVRDVCRRGRMLYQIPGAWAEASASEGFSQLSNPYSLLQVRSALTLRTNTLRRCTAKVATTSSITAIRSCNGSET